MRSLRIVGDEHMLKRGHDIVAVVTWGKHVEVSTTDVISGSSMEQCDSRQVR